LRSLAELGEPHSLLSPRNGFGSLTAFCRHGTVFMITLPGCLWKQRVVVEQACPRRSWMAVMEVSRVPWEWLGWG